MQADIFSSILFLQLFYVSVLARATTRRSLRKKYLLLKYFCYFPFPRLFVFTERAQKCGMRSWDMPETGNVCYWVGRRTGNSMKRFYFLPATILTALKTFLCAVAILSFCQNEFRMKKTITLRLMIVCFLGLFHSIKSRNLVNVTYLVLASHLIDTYTDRLLCHQSSIFHH